MNIAIDGPAGAGKSTISRMLAGRLGFLYVDTGALYRAIGYHVLRSGAKPDDKPRVAALLRGLKITLKHGDKGQRVLLGVEDVTELIRTPEISMAASAVSAIPEVRAFLLDLQRDIAASQDVVMDGRDIGTVVLPKAELKIFLTASEEDRAGRRYEEMKAKGQEVDRNKVLEDLIRRDRQDREREIAPLRQAPDAILVDTTGYELSRSIETLYKIAKEHMK